MRTTFLMLASVLSSCQSKTEPSPTPELFTSDPLPTPTSVSSRMLTSDRCESLRDLMVDSVVHQLVAPPTHYYGHAYDGRAQPMRPKAAADAAPMAEDKAPSVAMGSAASEQQAPSGPSHYTTTNVQEKNVDEADLVKTDGKHIYTIRNNELIIAKTWPVEKTALAARVAFKQMTAQQLYLHENEIVVQGYAHDQNGVPVTRVAVIDISDREQPKLDRTFDLDGQTASSRVIDGDIYLVQNTAIAVPPKLYELGQQELAKIPRADGQSLKPWEIQSRLAKAMREKLLAQLSSADVAAALPKIRSNGATQTMQCKDLYVPQDNIQLGITALARISIDNQGADLVGAMVSGGQVYASTEAVYVAAPAYTWNNQGYANYVTQVHKFSLTANDGRPTYTATGAVDGQILNQFSMSEHAGDLRVATTDWNWQGNQGGNNLFVLRTNDRTLETIGAIRGFAKGERIYSGRMFGDKGYLVTFRQTDPLFTLDLRDPRNPKIAGELKINGFSNYIHPMGGDLLLAIGQDATDTGQVTGFHMQVFDVSDPAKPTRRFHEKLASWSSYSNSIAEQDHKAFTYDPVTGTLALPVSGYAQDTGEQYNGLVVYNVDRKRGFTLHGRVSHRTLAREAIGAMCGSDDPWNQCGNEYMIPQYSQIDRSIVVDKYLLSLGTSGLEIHPLDKLANRAARLRWPLANPDGADLVVMK